MHIETFVSDKCSREKKIFFSTQEKLSGARKCLFGGGSQEGSH